MKKRYLIAGAGGLAGATIAAKLLSRPRDLDWEQHGASLRASGRSRFVEVDGVRVHYQEAGERAAPAILLLHGFCASSLVWDNVILSIAAAGFRVVAPDLVGFGFTEKPREWSYTIEAQARGVVRLMDALGVERATVAGSSYGGAVAAITALDDPERVERLVLVDAVSNNDVKSQMLLRVGMTPLLGDVIAPLILGSPRLMSLRMRQNYARANAHLMDDGRAATQFLPLSVVGTQRAVLKTLRRWDAVRVEREAHRIEQPTLLIWGEDDRDVPLANGERLHMLIPHSRLVVFCDCGHLPQEEHPAEFAGLVAGFCQTKK